MKSISFYRDNPKITYITESKTLLTLNISTNH